MRSTLFAVSALAATAAAAPWANWGLNKGYKAPRDSCLSDNAAQKVADNFKALIATYSDSLADQVLTVDFTDYSDSVNELINGGCDTGLAPLGSATFDSREDFKAGQGAQPAIPFEQLNLWHNCNTVTLRWKSAGPGQEPQQVTGIIVLEVVKNNKYNAAQKWLIKTVYSEFNSGAWLKNLGIFVPPQCPAPPPPTSKRVMFM
ncbi:hypothetical protein Q7P37_000793 [Cladosporium fusiforme]